MRRWPGVEIDLGQESEVDEDVILGYPSGRLVSGGSVIIGARAKIRSGSVIYQGVRIGNNFETGHNVVIREENQIGNGVSIWANTVVDYACVLGSRVKIHCNGYVAQFTVIEDDVFIAPGVIFANDKYPVSSRLEGPRIRRGARLGVNVTILPGITVGEEAMVGAGSVVSKDVPARAVVVGNPARVIARVDEVDAKRLSLLEKGGAKPGGRP